MEPGVKLQYASRRKSAVCRLCAVFICDLFANHMEAEEDNGEPPLGQQHAPRDGHTQW